MRAAQHFAGCCCAAVARNSAWGSGRAHRAARCSGSPDRPGDSRPGAWRALRVKSLPELLNVEMDQRQDTEQYRQIKQRGRRSGCRKRVPVLYGGHANAHSDRYQHHPLFEFIEHQQHRAQVHAGRIYEPEIRNGGDQHQRCTNGAEKHHGCGHRIAPRVICQIPCSTLASMRNAEQVELQQRLARQRASTTW